MPGVTIRKPRVNFLLVGRRTALIVCQAISIAITVVLPVPVAIFSARRISSGFASLLAFPRCLRKPFSLLPDFGATSVSQMAVSIASTWQKNGRISLNLWWRQCWIRRAVSGVTFQSFGFFKVRHLSTSWRRALMIGVGSYCCSFVEIPLPSSKTNSCCLGASLFLRFLGFGIGVINFALRRFSIIRCVGWPWSSSSQCRAGYSYGELRMGCSKNWLSIIAQTFQTPLFYATSTHFDVDSAWTKTSISCKLGWA